MPQISYITPLLEDGSVNPDMAVNTVAICGANLSPHANLAITLTYEGNVESFNTAAHDDGTLNYLIVISNPLMRPALIYLGAGGGWDDSVSKWMQPINNGSMVIEVI